LSDPIITAQNVCSCPSCKTYTHTENIKFDMCTGKEYKQKRRKLHKQKCCSFNNELQAQKKREELKKILSGTLIIKQTL